MRLAFYGVRGFYPIARRDQIGLEAANVADGTQTKVLMGRDGMVVDVGKRNSIA